MNFRYATSSVILDFPQNCYSQNRPRARSICGFPSGPRARRQQLMWGSGGQGPAHTAVRARRRPAASGFLLVFAQRIPGFLSQSLLPLLAPTMPLQTGASGVNRWEPRSLSFEGSWLGNPSSMTGKRRGGSKGKVRSGKPKALPVFYLSNFSLFPS